MEKRKRNALLALAGSFLVVCLSCVILILALPDDDRSTAESDTVGRAGQAAVVEVATERSTAVTETTDGLTDTAEPTLLPTDTQEPELALTVGDETALTSAGELATVTRIIDGDTIEVTIDGQSYRVRYIGMDTPERGQPFADLATEANRQLVEGQSVRMVKDISETDRYGRLLRYVYLQDGTFVNAELVRQGYAQIATYPPDVQFQAHFLELQQQAREAAVGLWADVAQAPPEPTEASPTDTPATATAVAPPTSPSPTAPPPPLPTQPSPAPGNVQITLIFFDGLVSRVESDEYAEITNLGSSAVNLAGWLLNADDPGQDFWFPAYELGPGQSCRVYTNEIHLETCGFSFGYGRAIWNNTNRDCGHLYDNTGTEVSTYCY
jgi:endonuclease YncB( thermonuclease family)